MPANCILYEDDQQLPLRLIWEHFSLLNGEYTIYDIRKYKTFGKTSNDRSEIDIGKHDEAFFRMRKI